MPRQPQSTGLFGQTPQAIRQAQINEQLSQASLIGNLSPGGHGALAGGMFGQAAGNTLGLLAGQDVSDPRMREAQAMQEIEQQITQMGLEPGTREFTETLGQLATMKLGVGAAAPLVQKAQQIEIERAELEAVRQGPVQAQRKAGGLINMLVNRMGYDPQDAQATVEAGLGEFAAKEGLKAPKLAAAIEIYERAKSDKGFAEWYMAQKKAGATNVTQTAGGKTLPPFQTSIGEVTNDILRALEMEPGELRDQTLDALYKKQATVGTSMEMQRAEDRMGATEDLIAWFQDIAKANPDIVGTPGILTKLKTADNLLGVALRHFNPTTIPESQLSAVTAQMRALLGTAFSGAAIPEREWPTYQAQVPAITDDPNLMQGKMLAYRRMMRYLVNRAKAKARREDVSESTLVNGELPFPAAKLNQPKPAEGSDGWSIRVKP